MAELENERHEKYAQGIAKGMSQRKAYREAFPSSVKWKDETVDSKASNLRKNDKVSARIEELARLSSTKAVMTAIERKELLTAIARSDLEKAQDRIKAIDTLNKMDGEYIDKVEVKGNVNNPFEGLTTEDLKKLIDDE